MATISTTQLESELSSLNTAITTYLATGQLPVAYSLPTGHSIDTTNVLLTLYKLRRELIEQMNQLNPAYVVSIAG